MAEVGECPNCGMSIFDSDEGRECPQCFQPLPESIRRALPKLRTPSVTAEAVPRRDNSSEAGSASTSTGQAIPRYKVVPFSAAVSSTQDPSYLASQVEGIISSYVSSGWEYVDVHQLQTFKAGSNGCIGLGATPPTSITTEFVVFRR